MTSEQLTGRKKWNNQLNRDLPLAMKALGMREPGMFKPGTKDADMYWFMERMVEKGWTLVTCNREAYSSKVPIAIEIKNEDENAPCNFVAEVWAPGNPSGMVVAAQNQRIAVGFAYMTACHSIMTELILQRDLESKKRIALETNSTIEQVLARAQAGKKEPPVSTG